METTNQQSALMDSMENLQKAIQSFNEALNQSKNLVSLPDNTKDIIQQMAYDEFKDLLDNKLKLLVEDLLEPKFLCKLDDPHSIIACAIRSLIDDQISQIKDLKVDEILDDPGFESAVKDVIENSLTVEVEPTATVIISR